MKIIIFLSGFRVYRILEFIYYHIISQIPLMSQTIIVCRWYKGIIRVSKFVYSTIRIRWIMHVQLYYLFRYKQ